MNREDRRYAVLIDADNVSDKYVKIILDEISNYGVATYKRIYADWTKPKFARWKTMLLEHSITPIQQYSYTVGKNATDSAMIIDAMDILYSGKVEGFCLVTSDSDFTRLASRLREAGMDVIGMGETKTPKPFISSCNRFKYLDLIALDNELGDLADEAEERESRSSGKTVKKGAAAAPPAKHLLPRLKSHPAPRRMHPARLRPCPPDPCVRPSWPWWKKTPTKMNGSHWVTWAT